MTNRIRACVVFGLLAAAIGLVLPADASAQVLSPYGSAYYYYPGYLHNADRELPYFAAHPPVYYSHIVPRPYGYSPYAYLPGIMTPGFESGGRCCRACGLAPVGRGLRAYAPNEQPGEGEAVSPESEPDRQAGSMPSAPRPAVLINRYVVDREVADSESGPAVRVPLTIVNPYVVSSAASQGANATAVAAD